MKPHFEIPEDLGLDPRRERALKFRIRTLMIAVAVAAVWLVAFRVPGVSELVLGFFGMLVFGLAVGLAAMLLGLLGFGLFAVFDRILDAARR